MAFEYNGEQHYRVKTHFHRNGESDFEEQQARDWFKYDRLGEMKIDLIIISYTCKTLQQKENRICAELQRIATEKMITRIGQFQI